MTHPRRATVVGGGSWGTALAHLVANHGYDVLLWLRSETRAKEINSNHTNERYLGDCRIHEGVTATTDIKEAATFSDTLIIAIPSKSLRAVAEELGQYVTGDQVLISATKGLEAGSFTRMSEILRHETCARKIGALSGPNLAKEVISGHPSATVVASKYEEVITRAERLLAGPRFRLYGNFDIVGVELAGALKNVIAIAAGMSSGLGFGANTLSLLMTRGLAEICRMGERLGADPTTFQGLAGIGDLIATCTSTLSRNQTLGRRLAAGEKLKHIQADMRMVAEGVNTTLAVHQAATSLRVDMPITHGMYRVIFEEAAIEDVITALMTRASVYEADYAAIHGPRLISNSIVEHACHLDARERNRS